MRVRQKIKPLAERIGKITLNAHEGHHDWLTPRDGKDIRADAVRIAESGDRLIQLVAAENDLLRGAVLLRKKEDWAKEVLEAIQELDKTN